VESPRVKASAHRQGELDVWMMPTRMKTPIDRNGWCFKLDEDIGEVKGPAGQGLRGEGRG
jgi:hypothetical protein